MWASMPRAGLIELLRDMGGNIEITNAREAGGEAVGDLIVTASTLTGVEPDPAHVPSMVDEFPIDSIAAAMAKGRSVFRGTEELRVKDADSITTLAAGLRVFVAKGENLKKGSIN